MGIRTFLAPLIMGLIAVPTDVLDAQERDDAKSLNQKTHLQTGESVAVQTAKARLPGRGDVSNFERVEVGTVVSLLAQTINDHVVLAFDYEKSTLAPPLRTPKDTQRPQGISELTHQSTLEIANGDAVLAGKMMDRTAKGTVYLVVGAETQRGAQPAQKPTRPRKRR